MINRDLQTVFEMAERHQLEVNAGIVKPDSGGITALSYDVLPHNVPLLVTSDEISVVELVGQSIKVKAPFPYAATAGGYLGFSWVIERSEHESGDIDRYVLGALTRNFHNNTVLWAPIGTADVVDIHAELEDDPLANDVIETLTSDPCIDVARFIELCEQMPDQNDDKARLYISLVNSIVGAEKVFESVNSMGCIEGFRDSYIRWGAAVGLTRYKVKKGDIFALTLEDGRKRLAIARRMSETKFLEKVTIACAEYGYECAVQNPDE